MKVNKAAFIGKWRITEMEAWDQEFVDMEVAGHFTFARKDLGSFQFGLVQGEIDWRIEPADRERRTARTYLHPPRRVVRISRRQASVGAALTARGLRSGLRAFVPRPLLRGSQTALDHGRGKPNIPRGLDGSASGFQANEQQAIAAGAFHRHVRRGLRRERLAEQIQEKSKDVLVQRAQLRQPDLAAGSQTCRRG